MMAKKSPKMPAKNINDRFPSIETTFLLVHPTVLNAISLAVHDVPATSEGDQNGTMTDSEAAR
jgi:hypothetical protein